MSNQYKSTSIDEDAANTIKNLRSSLNDLSEDRGALIERIEDLKQELADQLLSTLEHADEVIALRDKITALESKWVQAIGWAYADCCTTLDAGGDPRQTEMPDVLRRATIDLGEMK